MLLKLLRYDYILLYFLLFKIGKINMIMKLFSKPCGEPDSNPKWLITPISLNKVIMTHGRVFILPSIRREGQMQVIEIEVRRLQKFFLKG